MKKSISLITLFIGLSITSFGQATVQRCNQISTVTKGNYQSKNIVLEILEVNRVFTVNVNNKVYTLKPTDKTFEIDLTNMKVGEPYEIKITYCESRILPYRILNSNVVK